MTPYYPARDGHPSIFALEGDRRGVTESSTPRPSRPRLSDLENLEMTTVASELSMRARNGIERLLGPKCKEWTPSQLAARLAELSGLDVIRTPNIGRFTHQEIEAFLERHGHRFADSWALDGYPRDEMRIRKYALHCALVVRRRRGGTVLALVERQTKSTIGTYDSWPDVERAIERYDAKALRTA
jgi:hypothetical protein